MVENNQHENMVAAKKYHPIVRMIVKECGLSSEIHDDLNNQLKNFNFKVIKDKKIFNEILKNGDLKIELNKNHQAIIQILAFENHNYLSIKTQNSHFLLKDENETKSNSYIIILIFVVILMSFFFVFFTTLKKLYPIKKLQEKVALLGDEKFDFNCCQNEDKDEISLLAQEFVNSAKKLEQIKEARNVFIRNIMHELKTPITKGKFLTELPCDPQNRELMQKVFYRLEGLINEFAAIEEVMATRQVEKKSYFISDIIDFAIDLSFGDKECDAEIEDFKVDVNFKLFSIAIKNLIDNAMKYSIKHKANIIAKDKKISVLSEGERLAGEISDYFEPFSKTSKDGFGLGLYITNYIVKLHDCDFEYSYENGVNNFCIKIEK